MAIMEWAREKMDRTITTLVIVFLSIFVIYLLCPLAMSTDSRWSIYFAMSILREHNVDLDEYAGLMEDGDFRVAYVNGHIYSFFPLAVPVLITPYVWAVDKVFPLFYSTDLATYLSQNFPNEFTAKIEKVAASFIAALSAAVVFLLASSQLNRRRALLVTFIFAFATPMLSTASRALWQHGMSALCLTVVLWSLLQKEQTIGWRSLAGFLLGISYVVRPTNSISVVLITLYVLYNDRKKFIYYFICVLMPLALLLAHSWLTYDMILPPYYLPQRLGTNPRLLEALLGNLVSPNRGLFISSPILLFSAVGVYLQAKKGQLSLNHIDPYLLLTLIGHWFVISSFEYWDGGWSLGPRFFTDMIPYLVYFLLPVLREIATWRSHRVNGSFAIAMVLSTLIHFRYVTSIYPMMWNTKPVALLDAPERVWDLTDLQMLKGFCADKLEGKAPACWFPPD